ncbi:MAG: hypothetical protein R3B13_41315 [Polyangiaceae bacterium]
MTRSVSRLGLKLLSAGIAIACAASPPPDTHDTGASMGATDKSLSGCKGKASSSVPSDGTYVITTFGGPSESQPMACGSHTKSGSWYYAASKQRYGCGSKIKIEAGGKCVVAQTDDYGPDVCVESAAGRPIIDVSPLVAQDLFGVSGIGWSDNKLVQVTEVDSGTALGPCAASGSTGSGGSSGNAGQCYCDADCADFGDCCSNCGSGGSGAGNSGGGSAGSSGSGSGGASGGQCYCDADCASFGDCCASCPGGSGGSGSGSGGSSGSGSGGSSGSGSGGASGGQCYCDADCADFGDCCPNCV